MIYRKFSIAFKRQVVEEWMNGSSSVNQLSRRYEVSATLIDRWKQKYKEGTLVEDPSSQDRALENRVAELERMVGRLAMENDLLKKAAVSIQRQRREVSLPITAKTLAASREDAKS